MAGDGAQTRNERNLEPAVAHNARKTRVRQLRPLQLLAARRTAVLECAMRDDQHARTNRRWTQTEHALEVAELAQESARGDDAEAGPEAPDEAAEDGDDLVPKELRGGERVRAGRAGADSPGGRR